MTMTPPLIVGHAPRYTVMTSDLVTNAPKAILPMTGLGFGTKLNDAGSYKSTLPLFDPRIQRSNWDTATTPARTSVYVFRNDSVVWGGILWTRDYDSTTQHENFNAATFESFYMHWPELVTRQFVNTDQLAMVRTLVADLSASGNVLPMPVSSNVSGVLRNYDVFDYDRKWTSDIIKALQQLPDGFDFGADVLYTPGAPPHAIFNLSYPRRGRDASTTPLVFEYPGNITSYKLTEDGTLYASDMLELGAGSGPTMNVGYANDPSLQTNGWPRMWAQVSRKDEVDVGRLRSYAKGDLGLYRQPVELLTMKVRGDINPILGSYVAGDDARIRILDARFPAPGVDFYQRIGAINVTVADDGNEDVELTMIQTLS